MLDSMCCYLFFITPKPLYLICMHMTTHRTKRITIVCISVDSKLQIFGGRRSQILYQCISFFNLITNKMSFTFSSQHCEVCIYLDYVAEQLSNTLNSQVAFSVLVFFYSRNGRIGLLIILHLHTDDSVIDRLLFIELTKNKK